MPILANVLLGVRQGKLLITATDLEVELVAGSDVAVPEAGESIPSEASKRLLPWLVAVAFFVEALDTTILNTAVPAISAALHVVRSA